MKTKLLQGAAIAALAYAFVQPAWAGETTPVVENTNEFKAVVAISEKSGTDLKTPTSISLVNSDATDEQDLPSLINFAEHSGLRLSVATFDVRQPEGTLVAQVTPAAATSTAQATPAAASSSLIQPAQGVMPPDTETIVVSATKRETFLQDTPIAIAVVNNEDIVNRHVQTLIDLANTTPFLRVATFEARQSALTVGIRGIVPFDANQTARDQGVGIYLDGVYLGRQQGLNASLLDVERIEVLRGPQGTLFGRNTEGGAVSIITTAPSGVWAGRMSLGIGNFGQYNGAMHFDLPAYAHIAVKLDAVIEHQNATVANPLSGQYGWNYFNRYGGRLAARWTPFENFTADFAFDTGIDYNTPFYSQLVNYNPNNRTIGVWDTSVVPVRLIAPGNPPGSPACGTCIAPLSPLVQVHTDRQTVAEIGVPQQQSLDKTEGAMSSLSYKLFPDLELRSITAWRSVSTDQWDNSGGPHRTIFQPNANFSRYSLSTLQQHQFSQEFQAVGTFRKVDYAFGLYYFIEHVHEEAATPSTNRWNATGTGYTINSEIAIPPITSGNQGWDPSSWFVQRNSHATAKSYAVFGQATWTPPILNDTLHLTGGARWTYDKRDGLLFTVVNLPANFVFKFDHSRIDPVATVAWDATPDINLYATYSTGYRAGGANDRSQTFNAFGPESVDSYEVGTKTEFFNHRVRLNLAGYIMNRKGTQTDFDNVDTNPSSPTFNLHTEETRNAPGTSKMQGVEVESNVRVTDELTLGASYAYTDTFVPPTPNPFLVGNPLFPVYVVFTPRHAASAYLDYERPVFGGGMRVLFHLDANYGSSTYSFQAESVKTDPSFIVNGRIALADIPVGSQAMTVSLWARNLFDETHIYRRSGANRNTLGDYANFNPPRTFGVEASVVF